MTEFERTLVIIKPSAVQRGLIGEIITRFERKGLHISALKMFALNEEICDEHYSHHSDKPYFPTIVKSMMASPVVLMCLEGKKAIEVVRMMAGTTNGCNAAPGTIRGDYCLSYQENIIHASDSRESAEEEVARLFSKEDFFEYDTPLKPFLYSEDEV